MSLYADGVLEESVGDDAGRLAVDLYCPDLW